MASRRVEQVLRGINSLSILEKQELAKQLSEEVRGNRVVALESFNESFRSIKGVHTAPTGEDGCACCGR